MRQPLAPLRIRRFFPLFSAAFALAGVVTAGAQIKIQSLSQSFDAKVGGSGQVFYAYPQGSAEGPGEWHTYYSLGPERHEENHTLPLKSYLYDESVPVPTNGSNPYPNFTWDGGTQPGLRFQTEVQEWSAPAGLVAGEYASLSFRMVATETKRGSPVEGTPWGAFFTSTGFSVAMVFETTQRMVIQGRNTVQFDLLDKNGQFVPSWVPYLDRNGYLLPGRYALLAYGSGGRSFNFSLTPAPPDGDGDGISDADETNIHHTDPNNKDTDDDGLTDEEELFTYSSDPLDPDTDDDGYRDGFEQKSGKSPTNATDHPAATMSIKPAVELTIVTKLGTNYGIQWSEDLVTWHDTETVIPGTGGEVTKIFESVVVPAKYWRAKELE